MQGRLNGIKKTYILRIVAPLLLLGFIATIFLDIFLFKSPTIWFYCFLIMVGAYHFLKGFLFCLDSSLYFGSLLSFLGSFGLVWTFKTTNFVWLYVGLSFLLASTVIFLKFKDNFHLIVIYSTIFINLYLLSVSKNLTTWPIFIAFVLPFLLLLILISLKNLKRK